MIIKICGITQLNDAHAVVQAGADALGFMFVKRSARLVAVQVAGDISLAIAGQVNRVGVFEDPTADEVQMVLDCVEIDTLQFHGDEEAAFCEQFNRPYIKYIGVDQKTDWVQLRNCHRNAEYLLLDTPGGGTGQVFEWDHWPQDFGRPLLLAGGLNTGNVREAIIRLQPAGVDVSGGVEGEVKGIKVANKIEQFVKEVRRAQTAL